MSTKTNFKRLALGVIAALGLGLLSVAPASAVINVPTVTVAAGNASITTGAAGETKTAATISVSGLLTGAIVGTESYTVRAYLKTAPAGGLANTQFDLIYLDTTTSSLGKVSRTGATGVDTTTAHARNISTYYAAPLESEGWTLTNTATGYVGAKFGIMLETGTTRIAGDYVFTVEVTSSATSGTVPAAVSADVTFTVTPTAATTALAGGTAIDPSKTTAFLGTAADADADADISVVATADTTAHGVITVKTYTSASNPAPESITVTVTGPGVVGVSGGAFGKNITLTGAGGDTDIEVRADGTAGVASIVVATTTVTFPAKSVTFYALAPSTVVASVNKPVIAVGTNEDVVRATFKDANGNIWGGAAYIAATDDAVAGDEDGVACDFDTTDQRHECDISGLTKGTTTFTVWDASDTAVEDDTVDAADATVTSAALSVRVSTGVASSVVLSFDKATYAPGEKAQLRVSVLDGEGLAMPGVTITNALAAGGITTSSALGANSDTTTAVTFALSGSTSAAANLNAGHKTYVVYMPATAGAVTVSATGGTGIAAAGRVALTATATVVDTSNDATIAAAEAAQDAAAEAIDAANAATDAANLSAEAADAATVAAEEARDAADAATAAVEALATEVATLMAALKAQITTLANTVAKIAKKVKA